MNTKFKKQMRKWFSDFNWGYPEDSNELETLWKKIHQNGAETFIEHIIEDKICETCVEALEGDNYG